MTITARGASLVLAAALALATMVSGCSSDSAPRRSADTAGTGCSQRLSPGADVGEAISGAQAGSVICLSPGVYPQLKLSGVQPTGYVTLRSASGRSARVAGIEAQQVSHLRFADLTVRGPIAIVQSAHDVEVLKDDIGGSTCGVYLYSWSGQHVQGIDVRDNYIHDLDFTGGEGPCSGYGIQASGGVSDVAISNNTIARVANDYVQLGGGSDWNVSHNLFLGPSLRYAHAAVHQDLWQVFGGGSNLRFLDNVARRTATQESLLFQLGNYRDVTVTGNLFDHDSAGYSVQMFQIQGLTFTYNTFVGSHWGVVFRADDPDTGPGSGYRVQGNIFAATSGGTPGVSEWRSFGTYDYNVSQDGSASGKHSVRRWRARWTGDYRPVCLPIAAGYTAASSSARAAFSRRWRSGCS